MECQGLVTTCRKCGHRWTKYDPQRRIEKTCPDCGDDRACHGYAVHGYKYCEKHGGPNPSKGFYGLGGGIVTGETSRFPLTRLAFKYNQMQKNGALLTNRKSLDVVRHRLGELLERVDGREMGERVEELHDLWKKYKKAEARDDPKMLDYRMDMDSAFEKVFHDYKSWEQIMDVIDLDRRLVESEVKIAKDLHAILTAEDAYELIAQVFNSIIRHVSDPSKLKAIEYDLTRLVGDAAIIEVESSRSQD